ncbi:MAG: hypothetical protein FWD68_08985 [Alphaproteobacteria bacterium]|nr:hypothetical protein [Alphaproteobacteria bacterium]
MNQYNKTTRFFAAVLVIGGVVGVFNIAWVIYSGFGLRYFRPEGPDKNGVELWLIFFAGMYIWALVTGLLSWQGTPYGRRWVLNLFASQIPAPILPILKFQWFTGAQCTVFLGEGTSWNGSDILNFVVSFGAGFAARFCCGRLDEYGIGVNLFALLAVVLLVAARKRLRATRAAEVF